MCRRVSSRAASGESLALSAARSAGMACRVRIGKPSAASPRMPHSPWRRKSRSPWLSSGLSLESCLIRVNSAFMEGAAIFCASESISAAFSCAVLRRRRPAEAERRPSVKIAPLWVLTPPVARNMACSAAPPLRRSRGKSFSALPS